MIFVLILIIIVRIRTAVFLILLLRKTVIIISLLILLLVLRTRCAQVIIFLSVLMLLGNLSKLKRVTPHTKGTLKILTMRYQTFRSLVYFLACMFLMLMNRFICTIQHYLLFLINTAHTNPKLSKVAMVRLGIHVNLEI